MKVCVIGAGVIGCASAHALARAGHEVTLIDAADGPGQGASFANGGQLSYSHVEPLASLAVLRSIPAALWPRADAALRWRPTIEAAQWAWGLRFLRACAPAQVRRGTLALLALAERSRHTLQRWIAEDALDFGFARRGKLVLCHDEAALARQRARVNLQNAAGQSLALWSRAQCIDKEPLLAAHPGFAGAVWSADDAVGDAHRFCLVLAAALPRRGGRLLCGTPARGFVMRRGEARAVITSCGESEADAFVIAAGLQGRALAASIGERLPIVPVKGYSFTPAPRAGAALPAVSITDLRHKLLLAPLDGRLRVAAWAELGGDGLDFAAPRRRALARTVERLAPGLCDWEGEWRAWAGLRPATPDSLPIVRRSLVPNVLLNVGHGALGFTLAAGCAEQVVDTLAATHGDALAE